MSISYGKKTTKYLKSISIKKLKKLIKTELEIVFLANDDKKFLTEDEAIKHQFELETINTKERNKTLEVQKIADVICSILDSENWGIFFKNRPVQSLPVQDSNTTLYKVNEVNREHLRDKIEKALSERQNTWQNQTEEQSLNGIKTTLKITEKKSEDTSD